MRGREGEKREAKAGSVGYIKINMDEPTGCGAL